MTRIVKIRDNLSRWVLISATLIKCSVIFLSPEETKTLVYTLL